MLWGKKVVRITAAVAVAFAAAHTAESLKAPVKEHSVLSTSVFPGDDPRGAAPSVDALVPQSASLSTPKDSGVGALVGITPVAAPAPPTAAADRCDPVLQLTPAAGAMIQLALSAPCNRSERIVVRHSGLSFTAQTRPDGSAVMVLPALKTEAMVAVYMRDARLVLGNVAVPDATKYARYAVVWDFPADLDLRVTDGDKVLVGGAPLLSGDTQQVMSLGIGSVQSPVLARVYSVPGPDLGDADISGELRITPATCGRTLRVETVLSASGVARQGEQAIAVPLCGTSGDILVLKNLARATKLAAPE